MPQLQLTAEEANRRLDSASDRIGEFLRHHDEDFCVNAECLRNALIDVHMIIEEGYPADDETEVPVSHSKGN